MHFSCSSKLNPVYLYCTTSIIFLMKEYNSSIFITFVFFASILLHIVIYPSCNDAIRCMCLIIHICIYSCIMLYTAYYNRLHAFHPIDSTAMSFHMIHSLVTPMRYYVYYYRVTSYNVWSEISREIIFGKTESIKRLYKETLYKKKLRY